MRSRWLVLLFVMAVALGMSAALSSSAVAQPAGGTEEESESGTTSEEDEAQQGAGEEGTEGAATETGPPWTYQMARIALVLLVFLGLSVGLMYWRLIASRQRPTA